MPEHPSYSITPVRAADDLAATVVLFRAYVASLAIDLSYRGFDAELAAMPGQYAPPRGELLLARRRDGAAAGCVALRPLGGADVCEMKRLYVRPQDRGSRLGRGLVDHAVREARRIGYREMRLDTLASMTGATALYREFGFAPTMPY